jgi:hypothetical protein
MKTYRRAPDLGEHNAYVYGELLGMTDDEIDALEIAGITGMVPSEDIRKRIPKVLPE